jgi:glucosylceramidase
MRSTRRMSGSLLTLVTLAITLAGVRASAQTVSVWMTSDNQRTKMQAQPAVTFTAGSTASNPMFVDDARTYQTIEGFGASFTDSAAYLLNQVAPPAVRTSVMSDLFTRDGIGIGVSFIRDPMGASDLARTHYSYDDLPSGQTDPTLANFSIAHDEVDIIPLVRLARQLNPDVKIMATPWSPPGWMKSTGSMIGGTLLPSMYGPFAQYFVRYIQAYEANGIPIDYISLQNEALYVPADYPGMSMDAATQATVLENFVLPALTSAGLSTHTLLYDHNWDRPDYPSDVLSDQTLAADPAIAGIAWHGYGGTPGVMATLQAQHPDKGNYQTEHSGGTWVSDQVKADFEEITHVMRNWGRAYVKWSLALDQNRGPHLGGCGTCTPLVTINNTSGAATYPIDFYTLGHFSKFVHSGARRVYSSNAAGVIGVAFVNPDGSKALVAYNETRTSKMFQVVWGARSFNYTLPGLAGATFTWSGTTSGTYVVPATSSIQGSSFTSLSGLQTETCEDTLGGFDVGFAEDGDYALYERIDFGAGLSSVDVRVASAGSGGRLEFHLDSVTGPLAATVTVPVTGGWQKWVTVSGAAAGASGVHDVYVVFKGAGSIGNLNWFRFH